jgi:hypothetical protein
MITDQEYGFRARDLSVAPLSYPGQRSPSNDTN